MEPTVMGIPIGKLPRFMASEDVLAVMTTHGGDHVCLHFYRDKGPIGSFASDGFSRTSFFSENKGKVVKEGLTLEDALLLVRSDN